jgi:hypothetical protein
LLLSTPPTETPVDFLPPDFAKLLPIIVPLLLIQLGLVVYTLFDLLKPERRVKGGSKLLWAVVIILVNLVGPLVYLFIGREDA